MAKFEEILNNLAVRTEILNALSINDRIKVSSYLERYSIIMRDRVKLVGKLYGNRKLQAQDNQLKEQLTFLRTQIETIIKQ